MVKPQENFENNLAETIVGHSVKIDGDLVSEGDIKIDGIVTGKVRTSRNLFIGPTATIEADVEAGSITLAGKIEGNANAQDLMVILQTGKMMGDIQCGSLAVEEGGYFSGNCKMNPSGNSGNAIKRPIPDEE